MSSGAGLEVWLAAGLAALSVDLVTHPMDTLITRIQSPAYTSQYKTPTGAISPRLFRGLYQGFGPTLITGIPSSAVFWATYESLKHIFEKNKASGGVLQDVPQPFLYGASSAVGEIAATAIMSPAEVLKQNAQVSKSSDSSSAQRRPGGHIMMAMKRFVAQPSKLWTGYSMMVASHLPSTCITMSLYEHLKVQMMGRIREKDPSAADNTSSQIKVAALSAALAAGGTSGLLVPIDVIKTRMRLMAGGNGGQAIINTFSANDHLARAWQPPPRINFFSIAKETLRVEGLRGFYRGVTLTFITATFGGGMYIGCYEAGKIYLKGFIGSQGEEPTVVL